jgi:hypothetical protein
MAEPSTKNLLSDMPLECLVIYVLINTAQHAAVDADHGRIETRAVSISADIDWLQERHQWPGLKAIGKVTRTREIGDKISTETAYYLFSAPLSAECASEVVRSHWDVESAPQAHTRRRFNVMN